MASAILPGATLGILGGGQLGRMTALAARTLGYAVHCLDPDPDCPARPVVERCITARFDDDFAAADLARHCSVVTLEIEQVSLASLDAALRYAPVRPSASVLSTIQDRGRQKQWLADNGFPLGPWRRVDSPEALTAALGTLGWGAFVKRCTGGYDGRGQAQLRDPSEAEAVWALLGSSPCVVEQGLTLERELSVLVARSPSGEIAVYPPALNHHEQRVLAWSVLPGALPPAVQREAEAIARGVADALRVEGILVIELFLTADGRLLVNELAPRPHNSFHSTELACATSQFEQLVRAACDLPLGSTEVLRPAAIANLLGDLWMGESPPRFAAALAIPGVRLHLYGKRSPRAGRKMGHLSAVGATPDEALRTVTRAWDALAGRPRA